ncbi:MAG: NAD(P)H-dependent glycerol-3-phosphate dehydrogenase [Clostridia bacterium]|nr:NAD(P)H-dependent glycerol-3-phosphate dehydrogenase [Clostridia bacterium]
MNISVIGCGRWGSFIAWYLNALKRHKVTLYGRESSTRFAKIVKEHKNDFLEFDGDMNYTSTLKEACKSEIIVISVSAQSLRSVMREVAAEGVRDKIFVLCMKGIECDTGLTLSQVVREELTEANENCHIAIWVGPGHVQDFVRGVPGCMVIDSYDDNIKHKLVSEFSTDTLRFYYGGDMLGNEIGAALKNVIGIAAGMLDGMDMTALKGALTTRGTYEVAKLIRAMGGSGASAYGLCHLGDYAATVFSEYSNNRMFGEAFVRGERFEKLAEGYYTAKAVLELSKKHGVSMPICESVYKILYENADPKVSIHELMTRDIKEEQTKL